MIVVVMGVSGAGKTTIGTLLADSLECEYLEGDLLHPAQNIAAMAAGRALTDADRAPWLAALRARMAMAFERGENLVVGCSALKQSYRTVLSEGLPVRWVYLQGSAELFRARLQNRVGHFMGPEMLDSQLAVLEEPRDAIVVDASLAPGTIVAHIRRALDHDTPRRQGKS